MVEDRAVDVALAVVVKVVVAALVEIRKAKDLAGQRLNSETNLVRHLICVDGKSGTIQWDKTAAAPSSRWTEPQASIVMVTVPLVSVVYVRFPLASYVRHVGLVRRSTTVT